MLELQGVSGAPLAGAVAQPGNGQARAIAYVERFWPCSGTSVGRRDGEWAAGGWQYQVARATAALPKWTGVDRGQVAMPVQ